MKRIALSLLAFLTVGTGIVFAQFGFGLTVFDPSVYAEAVTEVTKLVQQYNQLVETYQMITNQYNQMLWMAKTLPGNLARFRTIPTPWFLSAATNTYGTTGGWISASTPVRASLAGTGKRASSCSLMEPPWRTCPPTNSTDSRNTTQPSS